MIRIQLNETKEVYAPGEPIAGSVTWNEEQASSLEVRLFWYTTGKGDRDVELMAIQEFEVLGAAGSHKFQFSAPSRPDSFSGKLITLQWAIEAILRPSEVTTLQTLTISRSGKEINLFGIQSAKSVS